MKYLFLFFVLMPFVCYTQDIAVENLLVYYKLNGNFNDSSTNSLHATGTAELTEDRYGNENSAYHFNGIDQFIDFPNDAILKPNLPISFSFWVNFEDIEVTKTFVFTSDYSQNLNSGINLSMTSSSSSIAIAYGDGNTPSPNSRRTKIGTKEILPNRWYFIVGIIKGAEDMNIYINEFDSENSLCLDDEGTYSGNGGSVQYTDNPGTIGRTDAHSSLPPYYFMGKIDEFRMWDKALTISEIENLCNSETVLTVNSENELTQYLYYNKVDNILEINNIPFLRVAAVYNISGQKLLESYNSSNRVDIKVLNDGFYILHIEDQQGKITSFKFIK